MVIVAFGIVGCSKEELKNVSDSISLDTATYQPNFDISKFDTILKKSDKLEVTVKKTIQSEIILKKENKTLKKENLKLKDSVAYMVNELKIMETKIKEPKKKNLIQKVFNLSVDSVEVTKIDTIK